MPRGDEGAWVKSLVGLIEDMVRPVATEGVSVRACTDWRLPYAHEIHRYDADNRATSRTAGYATDLLIYDSTADGEWVPRIVIECKLESVTTHDALTYSTKAATHKQVHPYLRYGILIGGWARDPLPARLVRHGVYFDFMAVVEGTELTDRERGSLGEILRDEVTASRLLQDLLRDRTAGRRKYQVLHRPLRLAP